jgi:peptidyl-prolyl cis-trans isomerase B (cyclophilin B)
VASSKRERELARMRAERQAARRAAAEERRRRQRMTILTAVSGIVVLAVIVGIVLLASNGGSTKKATTDALSQPTSSAAATPLSTKAASTGGTGTCTYTPSGTSAKKYSGKPATSGVGTTKPATVVLTTNRGEIDLALNTAKAPCTVNSFTFLAKAKYFDNTSCHRLTTSGIYVLQCGDPSGTGSGGPGYQFADENLTGAVYPKGTVAMANAGVGTNGSQYFLVYKDTQLPPSYTPFGTITKGLDVLTKVAAAGSNPVGDGKPKQAVTIQKVTVAG